MTKEAWKKAVRLGCERAGTYQNYFDPIIDTLAGIMERRDDALKQFLEGGGQTTIAYTNKNGSVNVVKNPAFVALNDIESLALTHWRELGLTPGGYRKITGESLEGKKKSTLDAMLSELL